MQREMILVPYDSNWANQFERIKKRLSVVFGELALDIQHFGSTSIIGMSAKPIIDVMVIVQDITQVDELMFRNYFRINRISFDQYQNIKKEAAEKYRFSPQEYTDYKLECV